MLRAFVSPLSDLMDGFILWRARIRMLLNVTSQVAVLEGYLRTNFSPEISIETYYDGGILIGLPQEGYSACVRVGLADETSQLIIPLPGEIMGQFESVDFVIYCPQIVDTETVSAEVERFRQVLTTYNLKIK